MRRVNLVWSRDEAQPRKTAATEGFVPHPSGDGLSAGQGVARSGEFGRTAKENGNRGTDHGHANCMFVMGGQVKGGKVYGKWPGLEDHQLNENRDLALTTDFRYVLGETLTKHIGVKDLAIVFPGFDNNPHRFPGLNKT
jgi:hypothetical protein